ncbi:MAG: response regulator [Pseudomonadota bacterium]
MTPNITGELVLNVDDTDAARYAKSRILSRAGFRVIEAASGEEALQRARAEKPDLVLLDTKLPDLSGFEVCRQLKEDPETRMVLVLQTSASYVGSSDKIRALDSGADNYLFEPIEPDELVANVRALMRLGRVERELRDVDRRKDEFLAILAHELRNPLGPIRNAAELLRQLDPDVPAAQENARQMILRQTAHMVRLVDDLLDVSRISQGKIALRRADVQLRSVLLAAVETAMPNIEQRHHTLDIDLPPQPVWLHADSVRLSQVVANLLNNAAKFTPPGGRLRLEVALDGEVAVVRVIDNGIGIAPHHIGTIFGLFTQGGHAADRVQDGLGIGLSLAKTLVDLHGGQIRASSPGVGLGSVFELRLATIAAPQAAAPELTPEPERAGGSRILVVDDNVDSTDMLAALLGHVGHEVHTANTGADAIAAALRLHPAIMFLDIGLPDMSGVAVAATLRGYPELASMALVALTGYGSDKDRETAIASGFNAYLTKPVNFDALQSTIATLAGAAPR